MQKAARRDGSWWNWRFWVRLAAMRYSELPLRYKIMALVLFFGIIGAWALIWPMMVHAMPRVISLNLGWIVIVVGLVYLFVTRRRRANEDL
jgi:hypothetical protein